MIVQPIQISPPPGHPLDTFQLENVALTAVVAELRQAVANLTTEEAVLHAREVFGRLMDVDKHYQRKENLLFSCLERHGVTGPSKVMWGKDDEVRELLRAVGDALSVEEMSADESALVVETVVEPALAAVEEIVSSFREGTQNVAEFWIELSGRFIHIRYFAVRNDEGTYLGTLEVTQDQTRLRQLEGERRLLSFETDAS